MKPKKSGMKPMPMHDKKMDAAHKSMSGTPKKK